ncbi:WD repeat-containing protein 27-like [Centruroides sculpturatus]|uniref:WD repeat-containing protein 27-like n=1 Tax=Centruroides sculpturatus TaxID=218467 RepID=UPI000C6E2743|nr:WD repeat-containing protein 27-like [Centruroides sculpturatus]
MIRLSVRDVSSNDGNSNFDVTAHNGKYLAVKLKTNKDIGIWFLKDQPVILTGHHLPIQALSFCHPHQGDFLCSCSDDNVILWDLSQYIGNEKIYRGKVLYSCLNGISSCCFSYYELKIALCSKRKIYILDLKTKQFSFILDDISTPIECCFSFFNTLLSISEDAICRVWKLQNEATVSYKSVIGASPTVLTIDYKCQHIAIGTVAGNIEIYQADNENNLQHISSLKIWKLMYDVNKRKGLLITRY